MMLQGNSKVIPTDAMQAQVNVKHTNVWGTDLQGLVDLLPGGLGGIQGVDELDVVQQAATGTGQQLQDLVFQVSLSHQHQSQPITAQRVHQKLHMLSRKPLQ